jgi:SAM-dependent methyltransferase
MAIMDADSIEICRRLECWYEKPAGQYLLEQERQLVSRALENVFGYQLLQLGISRNQPLAGDSMLQHKIYAGPVASPSVGLVTHADALPFVSDSIDVVVLHHAMEFAADPHELLREVQRVLAPQGHIIIIGFNPLSLWWSAALVRRRLAQSPFRHAAPMTVHRLRDWLRLLGSRVESVSYTSATPPVGGERVRSALARLDGFATRHNWILGGVYALHAHKQVSTLTPTRLRWKRQMGRRLIGLAVPKPMPSPSPSPCDGDVAA